MNSNFNLEILADKTIGTLSVKPGQVIWIWASSSSIDFIEALAFRIRECGAFWALRLTLESLLLRIGQALPESYLGLIPEHELKWMNDIDAIIEVRDHGGHIPNVPLTRRKEMAREWIALINEANSRDIRRISVLNPTPALAASYGIPLQALQQTCMQAVNVDYEQLDQTAKQVKYLISSAKEIQIFSDLGTDLRMRIDERPVFMDNNNIPGGKVYVAPIEDTANGIAIIESAFIRGKYLKQMHLTFFKGRLVTVSAPDVSAEDSFYEVINASSGDKDVMAKFGVGLNPGITELTGISLLDEISYGNVHIAIGMNEAIRGKNRSNVQLNLIIAQPTVWLDDQLLINQGLLILPD